ncbi:avidin-like [Pelodytes ibericus]
MKLFEVLAVALLSLCVSADAQCSVVGRWKNELGSNMTINSVTKGGFFSGMYLTAVSSKKNTTIIVSPLVGYQQTTEEPSFGFTVMWKFSQSTTVWSGQCFRNAKGERVLKTTWLLRSEVGNNENWKATRSQTLLVLPQDRLGPSNVGNAFPDRMDLVRPMSARG